MTHHFAHTDEQQLLAENLARLLSETHGFESRHHRLGGTESMSHALWQALGDLGVIGAAFDEQHGGFAGDARTVAVVMEELGSGLALVPYIETAIVAGWMLQRATDMTRVGLDEVISGRSIVIAALSSADTPKSPARVTASIRGSNAMLSGTVPCVRYAPMADRFLVPALASDGTTQIYQVLRNHPGVDLTSYRLIDGTIGGELRLTDASVPSTACLPLADDAQCVLEDALERGILASVAETVGIVAALNRATFSYLQTRKQFGVAIGSFQALQHRAADMYIAAEETLAIAEASLEEFGAGRSPKRSALVSAAKVIADGAARRIGAEAVQLHGGMGVSDEFVVSHYARRLLVIRHESGGTDAHRLLFGGAL